ncbi:hypothetical protein CHARACLAT_029590, partial [Characodon lateralis]|nr:hypothetical protein [Characodon lateralis]
FSIHILIHRKEQEPEPEPEPSCLSMKSNQSKPDYINFKLGQPSDAKRFKQSSEVGQVPHEHPMELRFIFMELEKNIGMFVKDELKKVQKLLSSDYPDCLEGQEQDEGLLGNEDEKQRRCSSREALLKITLDFLRWMKQDELADLLQS